MADARLAIHVALTLVLAWLAIELAIPGDTFGESPGYAVMARLGSEDHWAMVLWAGASVGLVGVGTQRRVVRLGSVLVLASMLGVVAWCFASAPVLTTAAGTYAVIAGLGYYLAWRRVREGV